MSKILLVDNYDSFTYNLVHILKELEAEVIVKRNDKINLDRVMDYDRIVISPGPGIPEEAGVTLELIKRYAPTKPILGVCLGEQAIAQVFGARLLNLEEVHHGVCSDIRIKQKDPIFAGLEPAFRAGRYHSWVVSKENFPSCLTITAVDAEKGEIMAIRHKEYATVGIQFHPESVLTPQGKKLLENWLKSE